MGVVACAARHAASGQAAAEAHVIAPHPWPIASCRMLGGLTMIARPMERKTEADTSGSTAGGSAPPAVHTAAPEPAARSVLVVGEHVDLADTTTMLLQAMGHDVMTVYDGWSAMMVVETFSPEIVLLDIDLPGLGGYEVAERLRRHPNARDARFIAITGWIGRVNRIHIERYGFTTYVLKPFDLEDLVELIDVSARRRRIEWP